MSERQVYQALYSKINDKDAFYFISTIYFFYTGTGTGTSGTGSGQFDVT